MRCAPASGCRRRTSAGLAQPGAAVQQQGLWGAVVRALGLPARPLHGRAGCCALDEVVEGVVAIQVAVEWLCPAARRWSGDAFGAGSARRTAPVQQDPGFAVVAGEFADAVQRLCTSSRTKPLGHSIQGVTRAGQAAMVWPGAHVFRGEFPRGGCRHSGQRSGMAGMFTKAGSMRRQAPGRAPVDKFGRAAKRITAARVGPSTSALVWASGDTLRREALAARLSSLSAKTRRRPAMATKRTFTNPATSSASATTASVRA